MAIPILLLAGLFLTMSAYGQTEEQASLYLFNPLSFNPAYAGSRGGFQGVTVARFQWVGIEGAPRTQFASFHAPIASQNLGLGTHISHDRIGARSRTSAFVDIAYRLKINDDNHRLAFGISAGADWQMYDFTRLYTLDPADPAYGYYAGKLRANFGAGLYYQAERFFAGISVPRLLRNRLGNPVIGEALQRRHLYLAGGYLFKLGPKLDLKTGALVKLTENAPVTFDLNANFFIMNILWIGPSYRFHESAGFNLAIPIKETVTFGYAFDFPVNGLNTFRSGQNGTHEVMLSIDIKSKKKRQTFPCYF